MILLQTLLTVAVLLYLIFWFTTYLTLKHNYMYYKPTYLAIKNKEYLVLINSLDDSDTDDSIITFRHKDQIDLPWWQVSDDEILFFNGSKGIKLLTKGYIHNSFMFWFDPYTKYWYHKIKEQIIANSSLGNMRDYKLKELGI